VNKSDFVNALAKETGQAKAVVETFVEAFQTVTRHALRKGDEINLIGFGKFEVKKRAARDGVNPKSGEKMKIAARKVVKFTAGTTLKNAVN
jgi:DNA-binding protein HU-beta